MSDPGPSLGIQFPSVASRILNMLYKDESSGGTGVRSTSLVSTLKGTCGASTTYLTLRQLQATGSIRLTTNRPKFKTYGLTNQGRDTVRGETQYIRESEELERKELLQYDTETMARVLAGIAAKDAAATYRRRAPPAKVVKMERAQNQLEQVLYNVIIESLDKRIKSERKVLERALQ